MWNYHPKLEFLIAVWLTKHFVNFTWSKNKKWGKDLCNIKKKNFFKFKNVCHDTCFVLCYVHVAQRGLPVSLSPVIVWLRNGASYLFYCLFFFYLSHVKIQLKVYPELTLTPSQLSCPQKWCLFSLTDTWSCDQMLVKWLIRLHFFDQILPLLLICCPPIPIPHLQHSLSHNYVHCCPYVNSFFYKVSLICFSVSPSGGSTCLWQN